MKLYAIQIEKQPGSPEPEQIFPDPAEAQAAYYETVQSWLGLGRVEEEDFGPEEDLYWCPEEKDKASLCFDDERSIWGWTFNAESPNGK